MTKQLKYFSTFTGIGGFEIGIQNAHRAAHGESKADSQGSAEAGKRLFTTPGKGARATQGSASERNHHRSESRPLCVGYSEINQYASSVFERHFKGVQNYGDITKINAEELPDFDCLIGGFPCQAFSIAGKRQGFDDIRGTLFFDLARILQAKKPRLCVFENVKGLLNHNGGRTFKRIISTLDELGYDLQWQVINSKNFAVPQNRERVIIVGHLRGSTRPEVFPIITSHANHIREITKSVPQAQRVYDQSGIAPSVDTGGGGNRQAKVVIPQPKWGEGGRSVDYQLSDTVPTIRATHYKAGDNQPKLLVPEATKKGYAEAGPGDSINLSNINSKTRRGRVSKLAPTLETSNQIVTLMEDYRIRKLTPRECERLQAFPDDWTEYGVEWYTDTHGLLHQRLKPMSDTQRYKMAGNAVTTNVIQAVFEGIFTTPGML